MPLLDTDLITERRTALGLTRPALARQIARSAPVIAALEQGTNHDRLTLRLLRDLASALALQPADLLVTPEHSGPITADDARVEAALATAEKGVSAANLAHALGWPLDRVHAALETLRDRLAPTGVQLHQHAGRWRVRPRAGLLTADERQGIERGHVASARLNIYDAAILSTVVAGNATDVGANTRTTRDAPHCQSS